MFNSDAKQFAGSSFPQTHTRPEVFCPWHTPLMRRDARAHTLARSNDLYTRAQTQNKFLQRGHTPPTYNPEFHIHSRESYFFIFISVNRVAFITATLASTLLRRGPDSPLAGDRRADRESYYEDFRHGGGKPPAWTVTPGRSAGGLESRLHARSTIRAGNK